MPKFLHPWNRTIIMFNVLKGVKTNNIFYLKRAKRNQYSTRLVSQLFLNFYEELWFIIQVFLIVLAIHFYFCVHKIIWLTYLLKLNMFKIKSVMQGPKLHYSTIDSTFHSLWDATVNILTSDLLHLSQQIAILISLKCFL